MGDARPHLNQSLIHLHMKAILKYLPWLDWVIALSTLAYGLYTGSSLYIGLGIAGVAIATLKPANRFEKWVQSKLVAKQQNTLKDLEHVQMSEEFYTQNGGSKLEASVAKETFTRSLLPGPLYLSSSKFNALKPEYLNLVTKNDPTQWT